MSQVTIHTSIVEQRFGPGSEALRRAVGGEFEAVGKLEYYLRSLGLTNGHLVVDVGCGSGRLAQQLAVIKASASSEPMSFRG
jgi:2-polyprenyl-3-methyl-5-hydroxy-6-metoxy-1,4-benzoquinol methylase